MSKLPRSLARQVNSLETQIMLQHRSVRTVVAGFKRKITARIASPGSLLVAFGFGVAMEQTSHQRGWSLAAVVAAANESIRLLLSLSSAVQSVTKNSTQESKHDYIQP